MFAEAIEIIHRQWTEDEFDFHGRHYVLEGCRALPKPVQQPPPIIVGGSAKPGTLVPAVRYAAEYNTYAAPPIVRERRALIDAACERAGRDPATLPLSVMSGLVLGATPAEVAARIERRRAHLRLERRGAAREPRRRLADRDARRGDRADPRVRGGRRVARLHAGLGRRRRPDARARRGRGAPGAVNMLRRR